LITYRRAEADDAALLHTLLTEMASAEGGRIKGSPETLLRHGFGPDPRFRAVLAFDAQPLGMALFFPEYSSWRGQMGLYVQDLYLRPPARGKGLGRGLMAAALDEAADWQPQFLTLMVQRKNTVAQGFYAALGFALRDPSDQLILEGEGLAALRRP
jgi:GNAT superfamily N-acetyltransferase